MYQHSQLRLQGHPKNVLLIEREFLEFIELLFVMGAPPCRDIKALDEAFARYDRRPFTREDHRIETLCKLFETKGVLFPPVGKVEGPASRTNLNTICSCFLDSSTGFGRVELRHFFKRMPHHILSLLRVQEVPYVHHHLSTRVVAFFILVIRVVTSRSFLEHDPSRRNGEHPVRAVVGGRALRLHTE